MATGISVRALYKRMQRYKKEMARRRSEAPYETRDPSKIFTGGPLQPPELAAGARPGPAMLDRAGVPFDPSSLAADPVAVGAAPSPSPSPSPEKVGPGGAASPQEPIREKYKRTKMRTETMSPGKRALHFGAIGFFGGREAGEKAMAREQAHIARGERMEIASDRNEAYRLGRAGTIAGGAVPASVWGRMLDQGMNPIQDQADPRYAVFEEYRRILGTAQSEEQRQEIVKIRQSMEKQARSALLKNSYWKGKKLDPEKNPEEFEQAVAEWAIMMMGGQGGSPYQAPAATEGEKWFRQFYDEGVENGEADPEAYAYEQIKLRAPHDVLKEILRDQAGQQ